MNRLNDSTTPRAYAYNHFDQLTQVTNADGNQTPVKTSTGIWAAVYDAENRPVSFTNAESNTVIECSYDYMDRRATKKVTVNGSVTLHRRYLYRGYLQIARCELYGQHGYISTNNTYTPYGEVSISGDVTQPIQWSSEFHNDELALVYYNYRHYNPMDGRWIGRDSSKTKIQYNLVLYVLNHPILLNDYLGEQSIPRIDIESTPRLFIP